MTRSSTGFDLSICHVCECSMRIAARVRLSDKAAGGIVERMPPSISSIFSSPLWNSYWVKNAGLSRHKSPVQTVSAWCNRSGRRAVADGKERYCALVCTDPGEIFCTKLNLMSPPRDAIAEEGYEGLSFS